MKHKWIKEGDHVKVIAGNSKDKVGKVLAKAKDRIIVEGVNVCKKHVKQQKQGSSGGEIVSIERPIHISNVFLCDEQGNRIQLSAKIEGNKKDLVYEKDGKETLYRSLRK